MQNEAKWFLLCIITGALTCTIGAGLFEAALYIVVHGWAEILTNIIT